MREIKTFDELFDIQDEKSSQAERLDLMFMRVGWRVIDGYVIMVGADCKQSLELFYISLETYKTFTDGEIDYFNRWYIGNE